MNKQEKIFSMLLSGKFNDKDVDFLKDCLLDTDMNIRDCAAHAIGVLKIKECLEVLLDAFSVNFGMIYSVAVAQFGPEVVKIIEKRMSNKPSVSFRSNAAVVFGFYPNNESFKMLKSLVFDDSAQVRRMAAGHFRYMKCCKEEAVKIIGDAVKKEKNNKVKLYLQKSLHELM